MALISSCTLSGVAAVAVWSCVWAINDTGVCWVVCVLLASVSSDIPVSSCSDPSSNRKVSSLPGARLKTSPDARSSPFCNAVFGASSA